MSDTVEACPECGSSQAYERTTKTPPWRCKVCGAEFDEPVRRDSRRGKPLGNDDDASLDRIPADTPDTVLAGIQPGDKLQTDAYASSHAVERVESRTRWRVPFGPDWVDLEVVVGYDGLDPTQTRHRLVATPDGRVVVYSPDGETVAIGELEHVGEVSTVSRLRYLESEGSEVESSDDPLEMYRTEVST